MSYFFDELALFSSVVIVARLITVELVHRFSTSLEDVSGYLRFGCMLAGAICLDQSDSHQSQQDQPKD